MNKLGMAALAAAVFCSGAAQAQDVGTVPVQSKAAAGSAPLFAGAYADVYYVPKAEIEQGASADGDGFGVRGVLPFGPAGRPFFLEGEYSTSELDGVDQSLDNLRFGLGYRLTPMFAAYAEYASIELNNKLSGLGLHGSAAYTWKQFGFHGELGYLLLGNDNGPDADGLEYNLGVVYSVTPRFSALADYRMANLSSDGGRDADIGDIRVGVRIALR